MPLDILHPRCVLMILSHNSIVLLEPPVEHFDSTISEARQEHGGRAAVRGECCDGAFGVRVKILYEREQSGMVGQCQEPEEYAYHNLALSMGVPNADDTRVSADHECASRLFPICDHTATALDLQHLVQTAECADHLYRAAA